jgi:hypothetical protein
MLLVPVILTIAAFGLLMLLRDVPLLPLGLIAFALLGTVAVAGIPYMIMSLGLVFWARYRSASTIRRAANLAPVILWLLVLLWWTGISWLNPRSEVPWLLPGGLLKQLVWISALVLGLGYLWVMLAHELVCWLRRRGFVVDAA